jgi:serine/threonine protein kinase
MFQIVYKLIDLGYAKELDQSSICTSFVGTLQYLAPELFMSKSYNYSVDYWSLGLVSHEVITGVRPFLPNMAPVSWMTHVKEKSSDDICAYQAEDGSIVFSKELFHQNHISSCLKYYMERWLTFLLEWNPAKRGRAPNKNKEQEIVVFDFVDGILSKKIVNVFSVPTYQNLSYEIDDSTAVSTLQHWIKRDTELAIEQQELLLPSGQPFDMTKEACQCWVPQTCTNQSMDTMVYVFRRGSLAIEQTRPSIPQTVGKMMEGPRNKVEYIHQKRAWAHAVFFLRQEMELYQTFLEALAVKMLHMISNNTRLNEKAQTMVSQLQQMEAQLQLSLESLHFDESEAKKIDFFSEDVVCSWSRMSSAVGKKITKLKDVVQHLQSKCEAVNKRTLGLQKNPYIKMRDNDILASLLDAGQKCYDSLRRRSKDSRQERTDNIEMVKVVYSCLKHRDKLLNDRTFDTYLQQVTDVQTEIEQLWSPLQAALQVINKIRTELRQTQLDRQRDIWMQMALDQCNGFTALSIHVKSQPVPHPVVTAVSQPLPAERNVNNGEESMWIVEPTSDHSPAEPKQLWFGPSFGQPTPAPDSQSCGDSVEHLRLSHSSYSIQDSNSDTSVMISDNTALRYATQDLMNESFHRYCKVLSEDQSLDWTFLERQD